MDIAHSEAVEKELDNMIRRRDEKRRESEGERREREAWQESVDAYNLKHALELQRAWREHYQRMRAVHWGLGDEYDAKLRKLENGHNGHNGEERP